MSTTLEGVGASEPLLEAARHVGRRLTVPLTATTVTILDGGGVGLHDGLFVQHLEALTLVTTSRFPWASPAPFRGGRLRWGRSRPVARSPRRPSGTGIPPVADLSATTVAEPVGRPGTPRPGSRPYLTWRWTPLLR